MFTDLPLLKEIFVPKGTKEYGITQGQASLQFKVGEPLEESACISIPLCQICAITLQKRGKSPKWVICITVGGGGGFGEIWIEAWNKETATKIWELFDDAYDKMCSAIAFQAMRVTGNAMRGE